MKLKPLYDKIVIRRSPSESVTAGGIVIPGAEKAKSERGTVIAVGEGFRASNGSLYPVLVKPGDEVCFSKFAGQEIKVGADTFVVINEQELQVIIEQ